MTEVTASVTATCSDCVTISDVVVGTAVPTDLIPTNQTADYTATDDNTNNKRAPLTAFPAATLMARAPKAVPLAEPDANGQERFMEEIRESITADDAKIVIVPSKNQLAKWTIPLKSPKDGKTVNTPIGVTGVWYPWPAKAKNFKMVGMHGCTGVLIVVSCLASIKNLAKSLGQLWFLGGALVGVR